MRVSVETMGGARQRCGDVWGGGARPTPNGCAEPNNLGGGLATARAASAGSAASLGKGQKGPRLPRAPEHRIENYVGIPLKLQGLFGRLALPLW